MNSPYASIALIAVLVLLMYFVVLRPQRKRQQKQQETLRTMEPGSRVMTTSGIYATLVHVGEKQMVLEISPGVEITVLKQAVAKIVPEGEEDEPGGYPVTDEHEQLDDADHGRADHERADHDSIGHDSAGAAYQQNAPWPPSTSGHQGNPSTATEQNVWSAGTESSSQSAEFADQHTPESSRSAGDDGTSSTLGTSSLGDDQQPKRD